MRITTKSINAVADTGDAFGLPGRGPTIEGTDYDIIGHDDQIVIHARGSRETTSGARGGTSETINCQSLVSLNREDLQKIFAEALRRKLVTIPGMEEVQAAKELLHKALLKMT